jgi:aspartyl-tRNA synthetase
LESTNDLSKIHSQGIDLILNGLEIASGGMRIHDGNLQEKIFLTLGMNELEIKNNFSFLLEALHYGAPPHGGIGIGIDRLLMGLFNYNRLRDFIAFPKNANGVCKLTNTPQKINN